MMNYFNTPFKVFIAAIGLCGASELCLEEGNRPYIDGFTEEGFKPGKRIDIH